LAAHVYQSGPQRLVERRARFRPNQFGETAVVQSHRVTPVRCDHSSFARELGERRHDVGQLTTWIVTHENLRALPRIDAVFDCLAAALAEISTPGR
jgi:hypothetical protein